MIISNRSIQIGTNGIMAYPGWVYTPREKPDTEIKETIVIKGRNTSTSNVQGTVDDKE